MAHQSLYRTYRPQTFDDVVGQSHITRTLRNAVAEGTVAHAYLFTGPRGTGKTTTARILAKALECEKGPTPDPDGTCQECVDIAEGRHPDVYELDAASRTGIDNVREEIIGRVMYAPTRGRWKIYIIDEVHMLSGQAFNGLLKTIEEPPPRVLFILCTTHPHKVPETIHSRCQRFDFRRIGVEDIAERLQVIADAEKISVAEGSLALIAKHAAGGMRDAITTLEQLAAFTGNDISLEEVEGLLGEVDRALLFDATDIIAHRDVSGSFRFIAKLAESGADLSEFARELTGHVRDVYVVSVVGDAAGIVDTTTEELAQLTSQAALFGPDRLAHMLDVLGELTSELRWSSDPRLVLEVGFMRLARPHGELTLEALAERIETLELSVQDATVMPASEAGRGAAPGARESTADALAPRASEEASKEASDEAVAQVEPRVRTSGPAEVQVADTAPDVRLEVAPQQSVPSATHETAIDKGPIDRARIKRAWPSVVAEIKKQRAARASAFIGTDVDVDADGVTLVVEFPRDEPFRMKIADEPDTRELVKRALGVVLGGTPPFRYQLGRGAVQPVAEVEQAPGESEVEDVAVAPDEAAEAEAIAPPASPAQPASPAPLAPPARPESAPPTEPSDVERMLVEQLGAQIVGEQVHEAPEWKDEQ